MEARIGDVVGIFLHDSCIGEGTNAEYNIIDLVYGRVMEVDLNGGDKAVILQPEDLSADNGGNIEVTSGSGEGATFLLTFPKRLPPAGEKP